MDNLNQQATSSQPLSSVRPNQTIPLPPNSPTPSKPFIILLLVMLIVIVGVGGYTLGIKHGKTVVQNQRTTASPTITQPTPSPNPTVNWKTYTHKGLSYQISFPPTWKANENNITGELSIIGGNQKYFIGVDKWIDEERSPEEVARSLGMEFVFPDPKSVLRQSIFNVSKLYYVITGTDHRIAVIPLINKKGSYIVIRTSIWPENESKELFDQILSTFKFTNVSWEEAVEIIRSCQVKMVSQTHSRNVDITLKDGTIRITVEPKLDMVIEEAQSASTKCGFDISVETE